MKNLMLRVLEGMLNLVRKLVRKIVTWEPLYNTARRRISRKTLVEFTMQKGAVELDGSGYHVLKLERPDGLSKNGYRIFIDDILVCSIDGSFGKVSFTEYAIKNHYNLVDHVRRILRNLSKGGLRLKDSFQTYFETKDSDESLYDRSYESNIDTHLCAVGWEIY